MKQLLLSFFVLVLSTHVFAQLEVKEGSFKEVPGFVNINTEKMYDDNDRAYSVVKVKTENINDKERHKLLFEGDARTFFELEYKPGEVWVYVSYYATYFKISHPDFGSTEFWFPFDMVGKKGYELTLVNKPTMNEEFAERLAKLEGAIAGGITSEECGFIVINTTPINGATVVVDGVEMETKTPFVSDRLSIGQHRVRVEKETYKPYVCVVNIEKGETKYIDVELAKAVGSMEIITNPDNVNIKIDWENKGLSPAVFDDIQVGDYKIELSKKLYKTVVKTVTVKDGEKTRVEVEMENIKSIINNGWVFMPEIVLSYSDIRKFSQSTFHVVPQLSLNYMIGPRLGFGAGSGFAFSDPRYIPLFIQMLYSLTNKEISPYINIKFGYNFKISQKDFSYYPNSWSLVAESMDFRGLYEDLTLGVSIKKSRIGISFMCFQYNPTYYPSANCFAIGLSYSYMIIINKK